MFLGNCYLQHEKSVWSGLRYKIAIFNRSTVGTPAGQIFKNLILFSTLQWHIYVGHPL